MCEISLHPDENSISVSLCTTYSWSFLNLLFRKEVALFRCRIFLKWKEQEEEDLEETQQHLAKKKTQPPGRVEWKKSTHFSSMWHKSDSLCVCVVVESFTTLPCNESSAKSHDSHIERGSIKANLANRCFPSSKTSEIEWEKANKWQSFILMKCVKFDAIYKELSNPAMVCEFVIWCKNIPSSCHAPQPAGKFDFFHKFLPLWKVAKGFFLSRPFP